MGDWGLGVAAMREDGPVRRWSVTVAWQVPGGEYPASRTVQVVAASAQGAMREARQMFHTQVGVSDLTPGDLVKEVV